MLNYRAQEGCHNCQFCKCDTDEDGKADYYCNISDDIPQYSGLRNTLYNKEDGKGKYEVDDESIEVISNRMDVEWKWREGHRVQPYGICDNHKTLDKPLEH